MRPECLRRRLLRDTDGPARMSGPCISPDCIPGFRIMKRRLSLHSAHFCIPDLVTTTAALKRKKTARRRSFTASAATSCWRFSGRRISCGPHLIGRLMASKCSRIFRAEQTFRYARPDRDWLKLRSRQISTNFEPKGIGAGRGCRRFRPRRTTKPTQQSTTRNNISEAPNPPSPLRNQAQLWTDWQT